MQHLQLKLKLCCPKSDDEEPANQQPKTGSPTILLPCYCYSATLLLCYCGCYYYHYYDHCCDNSNYTNNFQYY